MYRISLIITMKYKRNVAELNRFIDSMDEDSKRDLKQTLKAGDEYARKCGMTFTGEENYVNRLTTIQSFCVINHALSGDDRYSNYLKELLAITPASLLPLMEKRMDGTFSRIVLKLNGVDTTNMVFA